MSGPAQHRWIGRASRVAALMLCVSAAGCGSACQEQRDVRQPLSADEGESLMREIRTDRGRAQELTPAERMYLRDALKKR